MQSDLKMYAIRFGMHEVKRQEVVTYLSPVKVFATRIKIINRQKLSLVFLQQKAAEETAHIKELKK